jgi:hypothetical protein
VGIKNLAVSILAMALCGLPAHASLLTYSTASSFNAANTDQSFQLITFTQGVLGTTYTDGTTLVVFGGTSSLIGTTPPSGWPAGTVIEIPSSSTTNIITITPPASVTSLAFYAGPDLAFNTFSIMASNTAGDVCSPACGNIFSQSDATVPVFFGLRSTTPLVNIRIETDANNVVHLPDILDNVEIGTPETPEASTLLLVATGLFLVRYGRRFLPKAKR